MPDETPQTDTTQVDPRDAEIQRLKALADSYAPLEGIRTQLEADPGKYFAVQAALSGSGQSAQTAQTQQQQAAPLSAEQLESMKQEFFQNPVQMAARIADVARQQALAEFANEAAPIISMNADMLVDNFKQRKASEDPMYKTIAPIFDREMGDINRTALLRQSSTERARALELRWNSAAAQAYRSAAEIRSREQAQNLGGGTGGGDQGRKAKSIFEKDPAVMGLTQRLIDQGLISPKDLEDAESEIEYENS
jgi:hypothetical protein